MEDQKKTEEALLSLGSDSTGTSLHSRSGLGDHICEPSSQSASPTGGMQNSHPSLLFSGFFWSVPHFWAGVLLIYTWVLPSPLGCRARAQEAGGV